MINYLKEIWKRKDLLFYLVSSGLKAEHRNTLLGYFWWLLDPLLGAVVYYFLVSVILGRGGPDYPVYLIIGLIIFRNFSSTLRSSAKSISRNSSIITQVYLPKVIFPFATSLTQTINFCFGLIVIAIAIAVFGIVPGWEAVLVPLLVLTQFLFQTAVAMILSFFCVFIRDIENIISHIIRIMRYSAPVIWEGSKLPERYSWVVKYNPFAWILDAYRSVLMYNRLPDFSEIIRIIVGSLVIIFLALYYYQKNEHRIIKAL